MRLWLRAKFITLNIQSLSFAGFCYLDWPVQLHGRYDDETGFTPFRDSITYQTIPLPCFTSPASWPSIVPLPGPGLKQPYCGTRLKTALLRDQAENSPTMGPG
jgi:hypothetical protein